MQEYSQNDLQQILRIKMLLAGEDWKLIKELLDEYAKIVLHSAVNLAMKEEFDRDRLVNISIYKGIQSFIARVEALGKQQEVQEILPQTETIPDF